MAKSAASQQWGNESNFILPAGAFHKVQTLLGQVDKRFSHSPSREKVGRRKTTAQFTEFSPTPHLRGLQGQSRWGIFSWHPAGPQTNSPAPPWPPEPFELMCCHRIPHSRIVFQHSTQNIRRKSWQVADLHEKSPGQEPSQGGSCSWAPPMLLWTLLVMQHFQCQVQGQAELLCLPNPSSLLFSLSTSRTSTSFLSQETAPTFLWDSDIPRNTLVSKKEMGLTDLLQTSLCKSWTKLLCFAKQTRNLLAGLSFSRNSFFVPTD